MARANSSSPITPFRIAVSLIVGLGGAISYGSHFLPLGDWPALLRWAVLGLLAIFLIPAAYLLTFRFAWPRWASYSLAVRTAWGVVCLIVGGLTMVVVPVQVSLPGLRYLGPWLRALGYGIDVVSTGFLLWVTSVWLITRPGPRPTQVTESRWGWLFYAGPCGLVWTLGLLVFWPGLMSPDSLFQWIEVLGGEFSDWHPAFHTMVEWMLTRLWLSPAAVALAQIIALSGIIGWGLNRFQRLGTPRLVLAVACFWLVILPVNWNFVITLWKDVPYSIAMLALSLLTVDVVVNKGVWLERRFAWVILGVVTALTSLFRHNGMPVAFGTLIILLIADWRHWLPLGAALLLSVGLYVGVRWPFYRILGIERAPSVALSLVAPQLAAHVAAGTPLQTDEKAFLEDLCPLEDWSYCRYSMGPTVWSDGFDEGKFWNQEEKSWKVYWALLRRNPWVNIEYLRYNSSLVWRITEPVTTGTTDGDYDPDVVGTVSALKIDDDGNVITIVRWEDYSGEPESSSSPRPKPHSLLPRFQLPLAKVAMRSQGPKLNWLCWRPALYLYMLLGAAVVAWARSQQWRYLLVLVPVALHSLLIAVVAPVQDIRFQFPVHLVGLVFTGWLAFGIPQAKQPNSVTRPSSPRTPSTPCSPSAVVSES